MESLVDAATPSCYPEVPAPSEARVSGASTTIAKIGRLLRAQRFAVLGTCAPDGQPYASLVAFAPTDDLSGLLFATLRATRKFTNLDAEPRVSMLVDSRSNSEADLLEASALTVLGRASELSGEARAVAGENLLARHPALRAVVDSPQGAVLRLTVESYLLVSRLHDVATVHMGPR